MSQNIDGKVVVITGAQCRSDVAFAALTRQGGQLESDESYGGNWVMTR
jgi:hypothetical protein